MRLAVVRQDDLRALRSVILAAQPLDMHSKRLPNRLVIVQHADFTPDELRAPHCECV